MFFFFFFNDTATTEIYTLSLHDALPIFDGMNIISNDGSNKLNRSRKECRSEERFSRNAETDLVCRLLLEKKNNKENRGSFTMNNEQATRLTISTRHHWQGVPPPFSVQFT